MTAPDRPRPWTRVLLAILLFLPTPLVAAFPGLASFFADYWAGIPAVMWLVPAYLLAVMTLAVSFAGPSARMEG